MTTKMKKITRLLKYGFHIKSNIIIAAAFVVFAIVTKLIGIVSPGFDMIFFTMPAIFICQVLYSLDCSKMIASSDWNKYITVYMPDLLVDIWMLFAVILYLVLMTIKENFPVQIDIYGAYSHNTGSMMVFAGMMMFCIMIFISGCYKCYWIFTGIFLVMMMGVGAGNVFIELYFEEHNITTAQGILAAALFYVAGVIISAIIRRALYKLPVSTMAIGKRLSNQL